MPWQYERRIGREQNNNITDDNKMMKKMSEDIYPVSDNEGDAEIMKRVVVDDNNISLSWVEDEEEIVSPVAALRDTPDVSNYVSSPSVSNILFMTQEEYDMITDKDSATLYLITD